MLPTISRQEFDNFQKNGFNRIPLVLECFADLDTPLSVYSKLANDRYSYLLESADGGNKHGRYSIIGLPAKIRIQIKKNKIYMQAVLYFDRLDYVAPMNQEHAFALAIEKILKIEVPMRAQFIRVMFCEIGRILSHILNVTTQALDVGCLLYTSPSPRDS